MVSLFKNIRRKDRISRPAVKQGPQVSGRRISGDAFGHGRMSSDTWTHDGRSSNDSWMHGRTSTDIVRGTRTSIDGEDSVRRSLEIGERDGYYGKKIPVESRISSDKALPPSSVGSAHPIPSKSKPHA